MALLTVLLVLIIFILCLLQYVLYYTPSSIIFNKVPGPKKLPIIGNIFHFFHSPAQLFYFGRNNANNFKNIHSIQVVHIKVLNIYNPEDIEVVLSSIKHITKSNIYNFLHSWLRQGLLTSNGEKWHQRRKILTPAFHFNILKQFCKTFEEQSRLLLKDIESKEGQIVDVIPLITHFTLKSLCETAMGTQLKEDDNTVFQKYRQAVHELGYYLLQRMIKIWYHFVFIYKMSSFYKKEQKALSILHNFTTSVIQQRRVERKNEGGVTVQEEDIQNDVYMSKNKKRLAMLDLLLAAEEDGKIDDEGIREEVDTFMFEGHDTTAMGISFALMILANHRDVQDKIVEELDTILDGSEREVTMEDLNKMKYLEMCIKESLRMYPSVPFISRLLEEQVTLSGYVAEAGITCHIHIFDLHRDPNIYPNPDAFIPERFTLENSAKRHPFAYVPFSAGPRNCIGQKFAMYELKSVISNILRNFVLEAVTKPSDIVFCSDLVLRPKYPLQIKFISRK